MLPPPFLILPQAEINFNYFPSLAHDECRDNEALTLNKYVALGMCLVEQRTRAACAWWGLGWSCCSSGVAGEHHWRASFRAGRAGSAAWNGSGEIHGITCWEAALSEHGSLELGGLGFKGTHEQSHGLLGQGPVGAKGSLERLLMLPGAHSDLLMMTLQKHHNLLSRMASSILVHIVPRKKLEVKKTPHVDKLKPPECR